MLSTKHLSIMFTDMKGFTTRTATQSRQQLQHLLESQDELIKPAIKQFDGTIVKTIGDAFLVTFESPTDAVLCGMKIQENILNHNARATSSDQMEVRIAINSGEVNLKDGDVFGEPVNIASSIEAIAEPNEVYFTEAIYLTMNKNEIPTAEVGYRKLKGIPEEIKAYKVVTEQTNLIRAKLKRQQMAEAHANLSKDETNIPVAAQISESSIPDLPQPKAAEPTPSIIPQTEPKKSFWKKHKKKIIICAVILLLLIIISSAKKKEETQKKLEVFHNLPPVEKMEIFNNLDEKLNGIKQDFLIGLKNNDHNLIGQVIERLRNLADQNLPAEIIFPVTQFIEEQLPNPNLTPKERDELKKIISQLK
jgi:class 3 adenylate cyclase